MIKIRFNKYLSEKERQLVRKAVDFFMQDQLSARLLGNTFVNISFKKIDVDGLCSPSEDDHDYIPKCYDVEVNGNISLEDQLATLAHEIVHVRQFRRGELVQYRRKSWKTRFKGEDYSSYMAYRSQPWEKEARKLEKAMYKKFVAYMKQNG